MFLCLESKQCRNFGHFEESHRRSLNKMKLTVTHFLILNWQKKVKRQGWDCIFQKKKKGLKSSELFYLLFCGCNCIFFLLYLSPSRSKLQQETSNQRAFFFLRRQNNSVVCCFPFTCKYCPKKKEDPFPNDWKGLLWLTWRMFSLSKDNANVEDIFADKY